MSEPTVEGAALRRTPLHAEHVRLKARLVPFAGWELPVQYAGLVQEHQAVRTGAGLFDVSHMGELELEGPEAGAVIDELVTNDVSKLVPGQAQYTCACNEQGTILDDLIVYRLADERWLIVCNASNRDKIAAHVGAAEAALLRAMGSFHLRRTRIGGVECIAARTGYTGEDGFELFCANDGAAPLWRALEAAGERLGVPATPCGLGARDTLRLECRLSLYGNEIDETTNPLEAGLGWVVKLDKPAFLGKEALVRIKAEGLTRKLVGFEVTGRGIARHGYPLETADGRVIGTCTSGSPGPTVGKNIGLGYVPATAELDLSKIGSPLVVDCRGRRAEAVVVKTPFYTRPSAG